MSVFCSLPLQAFKIKIKQGMFEIHQILIFNFLRHISVSITVIQV